MVSTTIEEFTGTDFRSLAKVERPACVTFLIPNAGGEQASLAHSIPSINALFRQAEELLGHRGFEENATKALLAPIEKVLIDPDCWGGTERSVVVFAADEMCRWFVAPLMLRSRVLIGNHFYLRPLLPSLVRQRQYHILAMSENIVRLFSCRNEQCVEIHSEDLPGSLKEALSSKDFSSSLQAHSSGAGSQHRLTYHGHATAVEEVHKNRVTYCRYLDAAIKPLIGTSELPLVLACVKEFVPAFREVSTYSNLLPQAIIGNPDRLTPAFLHEAAQTIVDSKTKEEMQNAVAQYTNLQSSGLASCDAEAVLQYALDGLVRTAFVAEDAEMWGSLERSDGKLKIAVSSESPQHEEMLNLIAIQTVTHGGLVYALPLASMPDEKPAAAILRYRT